MGRKQTIARNKDIVESYLNGSLNIVELGQKYGISKQRVSIILMENGVEPKAEKLKRGADVKVKKLESEVEHLKEKYARRGRTFRKTFDKQRLEVLNLSNTLSMRENTISKLKEQIQELQQKLQEK